MPDAAALDSRMTRLMSLSGELYTPPGGARRKFDLAHMRALLAALGNPEQRFRSVLVAGTNGKGSTAATLASILQAAGYTVGLYTSPHLVRVNERIRILDAGPEGADPEGAGELPDAELFAQLARVEQAAAGLVAQGSLPGTPSFFETMTAIAMLAFASVPSTGAAVDLAVLEVGMGGRLDATNVVEPLLSIITDISLDHTEWLGETIAAITREKAGILRPHGTMITLPQHPEANQALGEIAVPLEVRGVNAAEYLPGREGSAASENKYVLAGWPGGEGEQLQVDSPLPGQHQQRNLALAIAAAFELRAHHGYTISLAEIEQGIRATRWGGRLERMPGSPAVLLDVAHNPAGAWALRAAISRLEGEGARLLVFGCMRDKAVAEMAQILFPLFDHVFLTELASPRAASLDELAAAAERTGAASTRCASAESALALARVAAGARADSLIVVAGSVVLVGSVRSLLL